MDGKVISYVHGYNLPTFVCTENEISVMVIVHGSEMKNVV